MEQVPEYRKGPGKRGSWLRLDRVLGELRIQRDDPVGRRRFVGVRQERRGTQGPGEWTALRRGWFFGAQQMQEALLERMDGVMGAHHGGGEKAETDGQQAERLMREELRRCGWTEAELGNRRQTDAGKVRIAAWLRAETVMTLDWIAARLQMGCPHTLANCRKGQRTHHQPGLTPFRSDLKNACLLLA